MEALTPRSPPGFFLLSSEQRFFVGEWMREDGAGFLWLDGQSVTILGAGSGATLDAEHRGRLIYMTSGNLTLTNVNIVNCLAQVPLMNAGSSLNPSCQPHSTSDCPELLAFILLAQVPRCRAFSRCSFLICMIRSPQLRAYYLQCFCRRLHHLVKVCHHDEQSRPHLAVSGWRWAALSRLL